MDKIFLNNITVLYVEDEDDLRKLTTKILEKFVKKVLTATNGLEGLELFKEDHSNGSTIDLVIADIDMPKMDGLTMLEEILAVEHSIPSIITTAYSDADFLKKAINCKVRGYVTKPLKTDTFIDTVATVAEPIYLKKQLEELNQQLLDKVEEKTKELRSILDFQENMILVIDDHKLSSANKRFLEFFGIASVEELAIRGSICDYFVEGENYFIPEDKENWINEIMLLEDSKRLVKMISISEDEKVFRLDIRTFLHNVKHYVVSFTDITQFQAHTDELQYQANHDHLTKLYNRQKFNEEFNKEILRENRYQHRLVMIMLDIDDFKVINDTYGHDVGDVVLQKIAEVIKKTIRITDIVCRWGGEEFMVLLPETRLKDAKSIAEQVRQNVSDIKFSEFEESVTISLGVAKFIVDEDTDETLLKKVDLALYDAKRSGKNKVVVYGKK